MPKSKTTKKEFFNKKARHEYKILDSFEVGIALNGLEIKAIRSGRVDMNSSYAKIMNGEVWWIGAMLEVAEGDRQRTRKLLLHKDQIEKLIGKTAEEGVSLIPLKLYTVRGKAKIELGLGKGMKKYDKRDVLKKRDQKRDIEQRMKNYRNIGGNQ